MIYKVYWKVHVSNISDKLNKTLQTLNSQSLAQYAYGEFVKNTPVKTGNARSKTTLKGNTIDANYGYANVLDKGRGFRDGQMRGSEQAPQGMTKPTIDALRQYIYQKSGIRLT
jgi:hypothetical protein